MNYLIRYFIFIFMALPNLSFALDMQYRMTRMEEGLPAIERPVYIDMLGGTNAALNTSIYPIENLPDITRTTKRGTPERKALQMRYDVNHKFHYMKRYVPCIEKLQTNESAFKNDPRLKEHIEKLAKKNNQPVDQVNIRFDFRGNGPFGDNPMYDYPHFKVRHLIITISAQSRSPVDPNGLNEIRIAYPLTDVAYIKFDGSEHYHPKTCEAHQVLAHINSSLADHLAKNPKDGFGDMSYRYRVLESSDANDRGGPIDASADN